MAVLLPALLSAVVYWALSWVAGVLAWAWVAVTMTKVSVCVQIGVDQCR